MLPFIYKTKFPYTNCQDRPPKSPHQHKLAHSSVKLGHSNPSALKSYLDFSFFYGIGNVSDACTQTHRSAFESRNEWLFFALIWSRSDQTRPNILENISWVCHSSCGHNCRYKPFPGIFSLDIFWYWHLGVTFSYN